MNACFSAGAEAPPPIPPRLQAPTPSGAEAPSRRRPYRLRRLKSAARRWQELAFVLASKREHSRKPHTDYRSPIDELSSTNSEYEYEHEYEDYKRLLFRRSGSSPSKPPSLHVPKPSSPHPSTPPSPHALWCGSALPKTQDARLKTQPAVRSVPSGARGAAFPAAPGDRTV